MLEEFKTWLRTKGDETFSFWSARSCALAQFGTEHFGVPACGGIQAIYEVDRYGNEVRLLGEIPEFGVFINARKVKMERGDELGLGHIAFSEVLRELEAV